jgi:hypothetical protein
MLFFRCSEPLNRPYVHPPKGTSEHGAASGGMILTGENRRTRKETGLCQPVHHKSHTDSSGSEAGLPRLAAGGEPPETGPLLNDPEPHSTHRQCLFTSRDRINPLSLSYPCAHLSTNGRTNEANTR